jgi:hypothetical protein
VWPEEVDAGSRYGRLWVAAPTGGVAVGERAAITIVTGDPAQHSSENFDTLFSKRSVDGSTVALFHCDEIAATTLLDEMLADSAAFLWKGDETAGATTVQDATANNRDGTVSGATLGAAALVPGFTCPSFDGLNDRIHSATYDPFVAGSARTFTSVAFRDDTTGNHGFFVLSTGGVGTLAALSGTQTIQWAPEFGNTAVEWTGACPTAQTFMWHLTFDEASNTAEVFINGVSQGTRTLAINYPAGANAFTLGGGADRPWKGRLGFAAAYESILSPARILVHAQKAGVA